MNKVVGTGKDGGRLTELWSGERKRRRDLKMTVWVSRFLRWAAPRIIARRGWLSRQEMNYAGAEENFASRSFLSPSPHTMVLGRCQMFSSCCSDVPPPSQCATLVKLNPLRAQAMIIFPEQSLTCSIQNQQRFFPYAWGVTAVNYPWGRYDPASEIYQ